MPKTLAELLANQHVQKLATYYRDHGESHHLLELEECLDDAWRTTAELAVLTGRDADAKNGWLRNALFYLVIEQRAQTQRLAQRRSGRKYKERVWRTPQAP